MQVSRLFDLSSPITISRYRGDEAELPFHRHLGPKWSAELGLLVIPELHCLKQQGSRLSQAVDWRWEYFLTYFLKKYNAGNQINFLYLITFEVYIFRNCGVEFENLRARGRSDSNYRMLSLCFVLLKSNKENNNVFTNCSTLSPNQSTG